MDKAGYTEEDLNQLLWFYHGESDSYVTMTRREYIHDVETSIDVALCNELGPCTNPNDESEAIALMADARRKDEEMLAKIKASKIKPNPNRRPKADI